MTKAEEHLKRMSQRRANELRLDQMDKNVDEMVQQIKMEISFAGKRDQQLVESRLGLTSDA